MFLSEVRVGCANNCAPSSKPGLHTKRFRSRMRESDKKTIHDAALVRSLLSTQQLAGYKVYFSLADTKYAGTAMLLNTKTTQLPISVRYNLQPPSTVKPFVHHSDGRIIIAKFADFSILHTCVP